MSRFQKKQENAEPTYIKLVALKFLSKTYLDLDQKHRECLDRELKALKKLKGERYCLQFHEHIKLNDCEVIVTDLIIGDDMYTMRQEQRMNLTEEEGRNILYKLNLAMA